MDSALQWKTVQTARLDSKGQQAAAVAVTTATTKDDHDDREGERTEAWQIRILHDLFTASP